MAPTLLFQLVPQVLLSFPVPIWSQPRIEEKVSAAMLWSFRIYFSAAIHHVVLGGNCLNKRSQASHTLIVLGVVLHEVCRLSYTCCPHQLRIAAGEKVGQVRSRQ